MSIQKLEPLIHIPRNTISVSKIRFKLHQSVFYPNSIKLCKIASISRRLKFLSPRANLMQSPLLPESTASKIIFSETFSLNRIQTIEGNLSVKLKKVEKEEFGWELAISLNLKGKWLLHWGVTYCDDGSEWDQPPEGIWPPCSITIKDYAIETPFNKSSASERDDVYEVHINIDENDLIDTVHFVLKEEETGAWYQHKGRDFRIPFKSYLKESNNNLKGNQSFSIWPGALLQFTSFLAKQRNPWSKEEASENKQIKNVCEEYPISKEEPIENRMILSMRTDETEKKLVHIDTDIPGNVIVHWGVCKACSENWEIPSGPHPPSTNFFRKKALQTLLQLKTDGVGSWGLFPIGSQYSGMCFVLKLGEDSWLNHSGSDFYIPLINASTQTPNEEITLETKSSKKVNPVISEADLVDHAKLSERVVNEIRNLVTDISSERGQGSKTKLAQENILQEIEKLAAEAYNIFRSSTPSFIEESIPDGISKPATEISSGTGSGYEILCQGFNWESHKSGEWYSELKSNANELSLMGFTTIWLPPPTESVSPEGYMPKDLYNLNSRYGSMEELKDLVKSLHEVGIKVLGDVVLNHRCAHYKNNNGIWNLFGGRLNWDDRAIVADDPHFQGKGNKSSGDHFHAAPNIDHSQDFVRKDIKEWLCWLRKEVGYDGWRLDFVRGFWGGYVKDYLEATTPYFAVGEYWDSLNYTYGEMDHNQDAHRQRIIDWINATNGLAGAFDVTTKGILHAAIEKCEYWRLSDQKGKPPGVVGWWPSRAVTFIENHDTGSTQGHWRFPSGKEMQGYAYILTHPGTPSVFYDHIFSCYKQEISKLISIRNQAKIHCRSLVKIIKADTDVYAAEIDKKLSVKIGPGCYEPSNEKNWHVVAEGNDYIIWEAWDGAHP